MNQRNDVKTSSKATMKLNVRRTPDTLPLARAALSDSVALGMVKGNLQYTHTKEDKGGGMELPFKVIALIL